MSAPSSSHGGVFAALGSALILVAGALVIVMAIPVLIAILTLGGLVITVSQCMPGGGGGGAEATTASLDLEDIGDSRPVIDVLPDEFAIPENYYEAYQAGADAYDMDWEILAAIGYAETKHGTYEPGWEENSANAMGPMQFVPAAWDHHGVYADGSSGTPPLENRNNLDDAVASAANKLTDQGINEDEDNALHQYNRSWKYVSDVQSHTEAYRSGQYTVVDGDGETSAGDGSSLVEGVIEATPAFQETGFDNLDCGNFQTASYALGDAPDEITAKAVETALDQVGKPYCWGGTGPDCFDCSGLLDYAYRQAGINIPARISQDQWNVGDRVSEEDALPGDFIFFEVNMGGREDAGRGNPGHVAMVVGPGEMVEAWCTSCGPIEVRGWEDRDVMGFTRPLTDPRVAEQITENPGSETAPTTVEASSVSIPDRVVWARSTSAATRRRMG